MTGGRVDVGDGPPDTLSLPEAVRRALTTHPDVQIALSRVRAVQADVDQAKLLPNPVLNVSIQPAFEGKAIIDAGLGADLVALISRPGRISAADNRLRAVSADALSVTLDVLAEVKQRYSAVQALDELMPVLDQRRKLLDRLLSLAESRLRGGEGTRLDVTTFRAQRVGLEVEIAELQLERNKQRLGLSRLIGQPSGAAAWKQTPWVPPQRPALGVSAWVSAAWGIVRRFKQGVSNWPRWVRKCGSRNSACLKAMKSASLRSATTVGPSDQRSPLPCPFSTGARRAATRWSLR
jgi:outer membrane protein TolC